MYIQVLWYSVFALKELSLLEAAICARITREWIYTNEQEVHCDAHGPDVGTLIEHLSSSSSVYFELLWTQGHRIAFTDFIAGFIEAIKTVAKVNNFDYWLRLCEILKVPQGKLTFKHFFLLLQMIWQSSLWIVLKMEHNVSRF